MLVGDATRRRFRVPPQRAPHLQSTGERTYTKGLRQSRLLDPLLQRHAPLTCEELVLLQPASLPAGLRAGAPTFAPRRVSGRGSSMAEPRIVSERRWFDS